jgi:glucan phosphorylase
MPVQILMAGKAHPNDPEGQRLLREVVGICRNEQANGKIVFLDNYDLRTARHLVQAADVWLNTPTRRMEASGTSGQKACVNGGLNLSILDGWWEEAYDGSNGWAIGTSQSNDEDAESLYSTLENVIIPMYFETGSDGIPDRWLAVVKDSIRTIAPMFNTDRMISEYFEKMYAPSIKRTALLSNNQFERANELAEWKRDISSRFSSARITNVSVTGLENNTLTAGSQVDVTVRVNTGVLSSSEIIAEMVLFNTQKGHSSGPPMTVKMSAEEKMDDGWYLFKGSFNPVLSGRYSHSVRIRPRHRYLGSKLEAGLVLWS